MPMMKTKTNWRLWAPFVVIATLFCSAASAETVPLSSFNADYIVYRAGKKHGEANRYLKTTEQGYQLGYSSDISWLIFEDKRSEQSFFTIKEGRIQPSRYVMQRTGSGPNRYYELNLNWDSKELRVEKSKKIKAIQWNEQWLDQLSYHSQLVLELAAGKTEFSFDVLTRHGDSRSYQYKVTGEELLTLPAGKIKTIRVERVGKDLDKQVVAWVAPELDYLLVKLWQAEDKVEQFDVQLQSYQFNQ